MAQNIIEIDFSPEERTQLQAALLQMETILAPKLLSLDRQQRRGLLKMGDKSEAFCRAALTALDQNRQIVPPSLGLDDALLDLAAIDVLRPLLQRMEQLTEQLSDTETALGSDIMDSCVQGYGLLKLTGKHQGLDGLVKDLGIRFARRRKPAADPR